MSPVPVRSYKQQPLSRDSRRLYSTYERLLMSRGGPSVVQSSKERANIYTNDSLR